MVQVKNIIFDFGGVILDLDLPKFRRSMQDAVGEAYEALFKKLIDEGFWIDFEKGKISEEDFVQYFIDTGYFTKASFYEAWNSILGTVPKHKLEQLKELSKDYNLYLLSNTNCIHAQKFEADMKAMHGVDDFRKEYFTIGYYSFEMGYFKPEPAIYEAVLKDAGLEANETLFIDDNKKNIESAANLGIQTILHVQNAEFMPVLKEYLKG